MDYFKRFYSWTMLLILFCGLGLTSCSDDDEDEDKNDIEVLTFYGKPNEGYGFWMLSMYDNAEFIVSRHDVNGNLDSDYEIYTGNYSVNENDGRIYIAYDGYSAHVVWQMVQCSHGGNDPYDIGVDIKTDNSGGELSNLIFHPGELY